MRRIPLKEFFKKMFLPEAEKNRREKIASDFEEVFIILFLLIAADYELDRLESEEYYTDTLERYYEDKAEKYLDDAGEYIDLVKPLLEDIVITTLKHVSDSQIDVITDRQDNYYLSNDRALELAENGSNMIADYGDYENAVKDGYTKKQWHTMEDDKVRDTHIPMDGKIVPIDAYFNVNGSKMRYPHDLSMNPDISEISNCRCVCEYIK